MKPEEAGGRWPLSQKIEAVRYADGLATPGTECLIEEVPVALVFNGISHAVMLATPADLEDFALGFSLSEGILASPAELYECEVVELAEGIELRLTIASERFAHLKERRRALTGRTGCGLCGVESLASAVRRPAPLGPRPAISTAAIARALDQLVEYQPLHHATGAAHAAAWAGNNGTLELVREDVGRHNALDKLIGALARRSKHPASNTALESGSPGRGICGAGRGLSGPASAGEFRSPAEQMPCPDPKSEQGAGFDPASGFAVITSRASVEMVQKAASAGMGLLAAISAPTAHAARLAEETNLTLVGMARAGRLTAYSHPENLIPIPPETA